MQKLYLFDYVLCRLVCYFQSTILVPCIDFKAALKAVFSPFAVKKDRGNYILYLLDYVQRLYSTLVLLFSQFTPEMRMHRIY